MVGIDIIEIERIEKSAKSDTFLKRVFTKAEIDYYEKSGKRAETLAGMYCVKEAAAKALRTGFSGGITPADFEVLHENNSAPYLILYNKAKEFFDERFKGFKIHISISHCNTFATAVCTFA